MCHDAARRLHGGLRLPRRLLLRHRRARVHGGGLAGRSLDQGIRWENIEPYGKAFWTRPGPGGKIGTWAIPVEAASDELYFNKKIFQRARHRGARPTSRSRRTSSRTSWRSAPRRATPRSPPAPPTASGRPSTSRTGCCSTSSAADDTLQPLPGRALLEGPARGRGVPLLQGADRPRRLRQDALQHDAGRGPSLLPHRAEGVHVPGRLLVHGARLRRAGQGRPAQGLRAGHDELPADEGRQGPQPEDPRRGRLAGRRGQGPQPARWRSRWSNAFADVEIGNLWMAKTGVQTGHQDRRWPRSTARSSGTSTSTRA